MYDHNTFSGIGEITLSRAVLFLRIKISLQVIERNKYPRIISVPGMCAIWVRQLQVVLSAEEYQYRRYPLPVGLPATQPLYYGEYWPHHPRFSGHDRSSDNSS